MLLPRIYKSARIYDRITRFVIFHVINLGNEKSLIKKLKFSEQNVIFSNNNDDDAKLFDSNWLKNKDNVFVCL